MKTNRSTPHVPPQLMLIAIGLLLMAAASAKADYQSTVLADNPLAFYALNPGADGTSVAPDLSGNANDGLALDINLANGPSPYITNAASFNGSDSAINLSQQANAGLLNFTGPISLEAWVQPSSSSLFADIVAKGYDSSTSQEIVLRVNGPYGANYYGSSGTVGVTGGTQTTNWTHVVLSSDGTTCNLYENGVLVQSSSDTGGSVMFPDDWEIGNGTSAGNGRLFNGNISEVAIYNHGLTVAQVLNHYYMGLLNSPAASSAPIISTQPQPQTTYAGGSAKFSVSAVSALPTTNQWYKNGSPLIGQTNSSLTLLNAGPSDAVNYSVVVGNSNGTTNSSSAALTLLTLGSSLKWSPNANSGTWDTGTSANWIDLANSSSTVFNTSDQVLFDDTPGVPANVTISGTVSPGIITVDSSVNNFTFGSGTISGPGSLVKKGSSLLTITSSGNFSGPVTISGGSIYAGNNSFAAVSSIVITNNSTLDFGGGSYNNHQPVIVSGNGFNGQGALFNSYANYPSEIFNITLAGDTTFGGSARWDLNASSSISGPHYLTINWSTGNNYGEWNTITVGADVSGITLTNGNIGMKFMDTAFQNPGTVFTVSSNCQMVFYNGGYNGSIHLLENAQILHYTAPAGFAGNNIIFENGSSLTSYYNGGATTPVNSAITLNGIAHFVIGDHNMVYTNLINGPGGFVEDYYNSQMVFASSNTYTGPTIIGSSGNSPQVALTGNGSISHSSLIFFGGNDSTVTHIDVSGRSDQTLTLASGQTLGGIGTINGGLVVSPGATIAPAGTNTTIGITTGSNPTGTLAAVNNAILNGTTVIKLQGSGTNDLISAVGSISFSGALNLININGSPLAIGDSFKILSASSYSGGFASMTSPGAGLAWDTTQLLSNGTIIVMASSGSGPVVGSSKIINGSLVLTGSGGVPNGTYYILSSTNLTKPLASWVSVSTNMYDASGNFNVTNTLTPGVPQNFYRIKQ